MGGCYGMMGQKVAITNKIQIQTFNTGFQNILNYEELYNHS